MCFNMSFVEYEGPHSCHICDPDAFFFVEKSPFPDIPHLLYHIYVKHPDYALMLNDGNADLSAQTKANLAKRLGM